MDGGGTEETLHFLSLSSYLRKSPLLFLLLLQLRSLFGLHTQQALCLASWNGFLSRRLREWHAWHADGGQVHRILDLEAVASLALHSPPRTVPGTAVEEEKPRHRGDQGDHQHHETPQLQHSRLRDQRPTQEEGQETKPSRTGCCQCHSKATSEDTRPGCQHCHEDRSNVSRCHLKDVTFFSLTETGIFERQPCSGTPWSDSPEPEVALPACDQLRRCEVVSQDP
mmetsp:Transcript_26321/g.42938  ORF Transcript_26321/g.42938 Transcript_26321/m.42938 type:complete len:225 (-) Transcript_26321:139-813(-)